MLRAAGIRKIPQHWESTLNVCLFDSFLVFCFGGGRSAGICGKKLKNDSEHFQKILPDVTSIDFPLSF